MSFRWILVEGPMISGTNSEAVAKEVATHLPNNGYDAIIDCEQRKEIVGYTEANGFEYLEIDEQTAYALE
jgi:hypothetical protein